MKDIHLDIEILFIHGVVRSVVIFVGSGYTCKGATISILGEGLEFFKNKYIKYFKMGEINKWPQCMVEINEINISSLS